MNTEQLTLPPVIAMEVFQRMVKNPNVVVKNFTSVMDNNGNMETTIEYFPISELKQK